MFNAGETNGLTLSVVSLTSVSTTSTVELRVSSTDAFAMVNGATQTLTVTPQPTTPTQVVPPPVVVIEQVTFTVTLSPDTVVAGAEATLTVTPLSALPRLVTVSVDVFETGVLSNVFPSTLVFNAGETNGLTLSVMSLASVSTTSTVELSVSGDAFAMVNGATQTLTVTPQPTTPTQVVPPPVVVIEQVTFTVTLSPDTVVAGAEATLLITPLSALPRLVTVSVSVLETGVLSNVFPSTLVFNAGEASGLTLSVMSLASVSTTSTVELRVSSTDAFAMVNGATQTLTVTPQPTTPTQVVPPPAVVIEQVTFTVMLSTMSVTAGESATLTVTPLSALPRLVTVSVSVSETGVLSNVFPSELVFDTGKTTALMVTLDTLDTLSVSATVEVSVTTTDGFTTINGKTQSLVVTPQPTTTTPTQVIPPPTVVLEQVTFTVTLNPNPVVAGETATLTVTPLSALPRLVTVSVSVSETGVLSGMFPSTLVFSVGETTALSVSVMSSASVSTTSTVELRVSGDAATTINGAPQTLTVTPQPTTPTQVVPPPAVGIAQVTFTVMLSPDTVIAGESATLTVTPLSALPRLVTVSVAVSAAGMLSNVFPSTLVFNTGETAGLTLSVGSLASVSTTSTVELRLSGDAFTTINGATQTLTVTPLAPVIPPPVVLDHVTFTVTVSTLNVTAGDSVILTITPSEDLPRNVTLNIAVVDNGNALTNTPLTPFTIGMGTRAGTVITLNTDRTLSNSAMVEIMVSSDNYTTINNAMQILTVTPQQVTFTVTFSPNSVVAGETATLTVTPSGILPRDISLSIDYRDTNSVLERTPRRVLNFTAGTASAETVTIRTMSGMSQLSTVTIMVTTPDAFTTIVSGTQSLTVTPLAPVVPPVVVVEQVTFTVALSPERSDSWS